LAETISTGNATIGNLTYGIYKNSQFPLNAKEVNWSKTILIPYLFIHGYERSSDQNQREVLKNNQAIFTRPFKEGYENFG